MIAACLLSIVGLVIVALSSLATWSAGANLGEHR
jgi:hypothetical protein